MAASRDRSRHDRAVRSLRYRILCARTLEQLCNVLSFEKWEINQLKELGMDLETWRRLSPTHSEQILNCPVVSDIQIDKKARFQDALFAEEILLTRFARAHVIGNGDLPEQKLSKNMMTLRYRQQASDLDVTSRLCFASTLPDVRNGSANGFFPHRICEFLGMTEKMGIGIIFGNHCIQIGKFRIGTVCGDTDTVNHAHLCIGHEGGKMIQVFRSDGTLHPGNGHRTDWNPWSMDILMC